MSLQAPTRIPLHTRAVTYRGFFRSDGLWDIEGRLVDTKDYPISRFDRVTLQPGSPAHDMFIRLTVDADLKIVDVESGMPSTPFEDCLHASEPLRAMVGVTIGAGWRKAIDAAMGGVNGCTHLRELLFNMATAAMQTIPSHIQHLSQQRGEPEPVPTSVPFYVGQCMSWRRDGPAVQRIYPQFFIAPVKSPDGNENP